MEKNVKVKHQGALNQRNWTNPRTGETILISSVELLLSDGIDTFVAEVTDQQAISINQEPLDQNKLYGVQCRLEVSKGKSQNNGIQNQSASEERLFNRIRITKIQAV